MEIPTILSGPIVRRVEPTQINIWIALNQRFEANAELFQVQINEETHAYTSVSCNTEANTIRLGNKLFISLVKIIPSDDTFPTDTLLAYNLHFSANKKKFDLGSLGLLDTISYGELKYPTFYIHTGEETNILYSSCRKLHGMGRDALAAADKSLQVNHMDLSSRPNALFMVGDQIYADDVADPISPFLKLLGQTLIGQEEELTSVEDQLEPFESNLKLIHGRQFIVENFCKFTSRKPFNHLMEFGEYAAMYLLSWNPQLWNLYEFKELKKEDVYFIYPEEEPFHNEREKEWIEHQNRYKAHKRRLQQYKKTLPNVRRLLANIPTYMIFDDHDLTDDWNISSDWKTDVWNAPLGRHVIANGLTAYWAFQGWGNAPDSFNSNFWKTIYKYFKTMNIGSSAYEKWIKLVWEFDSWQFVAPTKPATLFLDTRTQREFDISPKPDKIGNVIKESRRGPNLISKKGWENSSLRLYESGWTANQPLVIVTPVPLYGIGLIESFLYHYISPLKIIRLPVQTNFDLEAWRYNGKGFNDFHKQILKWNPSHCIILSGDAHTASAVNTKVTFQNQKEMELYQFTSSPLKNESFSGIKGLALKTSVWLYGQQTHNHQFKRYCDQNFNMFLENDTQTPNTYIWSEKIRYLPIENGSIIDTENNIGQVTINSGLIKNTLLKNKQSVSFESVPLKKQQAE